MHNDVEKALRGTLSDLGLENLDLYLIHWPCTQDPVTKKYTMTKDQIKKTWTEMERMVDIGLTSSIGVSNFTIDHLKDVLSYARIKPVTNQVELHPYLAQFELSNFCKQHGIVLTAYSPLGSIPGPNTILNDSVVADIAKKHGKSNANVLINWSIQSGHSCIPKSSNSERIKINFETVQLTEQDMTALNELTTTNPTRYVNPIGFFNIDVFGKSGHDE